MTLLKGSTNETVLSAVSFPKPKYMFDGKNKEAQFKNDQKNRRVVDTSLSNIPNVLEADHLRLYVNVRARF